MDVLFRFAIKQALYYWTRIRFFADFQLIEV